MFKAKKGQARVDAVFARLDGAISELECGVAELNTNINDNDVSITWLQADNKTLVTSSKRANRLLTKLYELTGANG